MNQFQFVMVLGMMIEERSPLLFDLIRDAGRDDKHFTHSIITVPDRGLLGEYVVRFPYWNVTRQDDLFYQMEEESMDLYYEAFHTEILKSQ